MSEIHHAALQGFGQQADAYDRGRPSYPPALLDWLIGELGLKAAARVIDLGAGTGKFTQLLLQTGASTIAVEPVAAMREQLQRNLPEVRCVDGTAQSIPLPDACAEAVTCAQAFHWFANHESLRAIHRVLAPGGRLGLIWNLRDDSVDWVARITALLTPYEGDTPRFYRGSWQQAFTGEYFSPAEESVFNYEHVGSAQQVIMDRSLSISFIAALPAAERALIAGRLHQLIDTHPQLAGRASIVFPYRTYAYCYRRLGR